MTDAVTVLVVEDGTEYTDAFRALASGGAPRGVEFVRAGSGAEARRIVSQRRVDAVFLDVVFDRIAPEFLSGDFEAAVRRFGGDRERARRHLSEHQGFYLLELLAPVLPPGAPVTIAYDFGAEPERLAALRAKRAPLSGVSDGAPISVVLEDLLASVTSGDRRGDPP